MRAGRQISPGSFLIPPFFSALTEKVWVDSQIHLEGTNPRSSETSPTIRRVVDEGHG